MEILVDVCAECVRLNRKRQALSRSTQPYTVIQGSREATVKLCAEHGAPFEAVLPGRTGRKPQVDPGPEIIGPAPAKIPAKKTAAKKTAAAPAKKTAAKKTAAKKTTAKKTAAKKTAAKKAASASAVGGAGAQVAPPATGTTGTSS